MSQIVKNMPGRSDIRTMDKKIEITILTNEKEVEELKGFIQSMPPVPLIEEEKPQQDEVISSYISRYTYKEASAIPRMLDILTGTDPKQKKRLLYAINGIRKNVDPNFRIEEPELINVLFSLIKYKSLEWPLLELLTTYKPDGYTLQLKKWLTNRRASVVGSILHHLTYIGQYDCLRIVEKLTTRRRSDLVQWPLILMVLKNINSFHGNTVAPYIQAIIMQLFKRKIISMEGVRKDSMKEFQMHYMHFLCLHGTSEVAPYIEEITPFLQKDYLAYFRYRMGITTDHTEIFLAMETHSWSATYSEFAQNTRPYMTEEWKVHMMQYFLRKMKKAPYIDDLYRIEALCNTICGAEFIKDHISLVEDPDDANSLLRLHAIRNLPPEGILSDMLSVNFLRDVQKESAIEWVKAAQRNAPEALFGYIRYFVPGKFKRDYYTGQVSDAVYVQQHIVQWAKDCGTILDGLCVYVEENEEKDSVGLVKAVFRDTGYILKKTSAFDAYDQDLAITLLNTLLEYENVPERLVEFPSSYSQCIVFGDMKVLQTLLAKYDYTKSEVKTSK